MIPEELGISAIALSSLSEFFAVIMIVAPFSDRVFAIANPIPLLPPVTSATFPVNFNSFQLEIRNL